MSFGSVFSSECNNYVLIWTEMKAKNLSPPPFILGLKHLTKLMHRVVIKDDDDVLSLLINVCFEVDGRSAKHLKNTEIFDENDPS